MSSSDSPTVNVMPQMPVRSISSRTIDVTLPIGLTPIVTPDQFGEIVQANPDLRLELTATGKLIVIAPAGSETGHRNLSLSGQLYVWAVQNEELGKGFDSSAGFTLPNGAIRSPDASWVGRERWEALTPSERKGFAPLCPDVVIELRSENDSLSDLQAKLREYRENGAQLGLLLDPQRRVVEVYRPGAEVETLQNPSQVSAGDIMPGFILHLKGIFQFGGEL
jgi:Uma2 family endonuclease